MKFLFLAISIRTYLSKRYLRIHSTWCSNIQNLRLIANLMQLAEDPKDNFGLGCLFTSWNYRSCSINKTWQKFNLNLLLSIRLRYVMRRNLLLGNLIHFKLPRTAPGNLSKQTPRLLKVINLKVSTSQGCGSFRFEEARKVRLSQQNR